MVIVVIGVAGSGKTTVGTLLAQAMHCTFLEGDSLHSKQNIHKRYRAVLAEGIPITWVYLKGSFELIRSRLRRRPNHFMKADMLESQFNTLEEPSNAFIVDVSLPPRAIVEQILSQLYIEKRPEGLECR